MLTIFYKIPGGLLFLISVGTSASGAFRDFHLRCIDRPPEEAPMRREVPRGLQNAGGGDRG